VVHEAGTPPAEEIQRKLLVLNLADPFPEELLRILERDHSVTVRTGVASAFSDLVRSGLGAVQLNVRRDVVADALQLVRELRRAENAVPIVVVTPYVLRSSDRTRALRAGADDFLSTNLPPDEFIARVGSIAQRGRSENTPAAEPEAPIFLQPSRDGESYYLLDAAGFRNAIGLHLARQRAPFFTVIRAEPVSGDVMTLADLALRMNRLDSGDLVGFEGRSVLLYLDGARPKELKAYLGRLNDEWRRIAGDEMAVETFGFPADESQIRSFARIAPAP
jgi:DNA-binding response OmpR family regulator